MKKINGSTFAQGLISKGPIQENQKELMLYGQFVGDWIADTIEYLEDGNIKYSKWDIRFDWVLEGRAIQDLWISPLRDKDEVNLDKEGNRYSTTLRIYDPNISGWHIIWVNPPSGIIVHQTGRLIGNEIVQIGEVDKFGHQTRWVYRDITHNSFRWCNEKTYDNGNSWKLLQEMNAKRKLDSHNL